VARTKKPATKRSTVHTKKTSRPAKNRRVLVMVATRKGVWLYRGDAARKTWQADGPHFLGHVVNHVVLDPRDGKTMLAAGKTGHLGPTMFRSTDQGRSWKEAKLPPAFARAPEGEKGRSVDHTFWLTPAHVNEPHVWYAGTSPQGIFRSDDGGDAWHPYTSVNDDPQFRIWMGTVQDGTPDGPKLHSFIVDPRNPAHFYFGMSGGGVHESLDGGRTWKPLVQGLDVVQGFDPANLMVHDPHCIRLCPSNPDRLYQQNHCGIYRIDRPSEVWVRIGKTMPKQVGDIGFPMVVHPRNDDTAWVFPMDGQTVWPRVSLAGKPAAYVTRNGGKSWQRLDAGLPKSQGWWTVKRQAMTADTKEPVGLYFGTTSGELWMSRDEGERWGVIAQHLPEIFAVEAAELQ
jgi:photosystem II stability/assembly factor-like uncharacterized protein